MLVVESSQYFQDTNIRAVRQKRMDSCRSLMTDKDLEGLFVTSDAELSWLIGYQGIGLERPTILVMGKDSKPVILVPLLERARVDHDAELFDLYAYDETENPIQKAYRLLGKARKVVISDDAPSAFLLELLTYDRDFLFSLTSSLFTNLRAVKDDLEIHLLTLAAQAADKVAEALLGGKIELLGRSEKQVSKVISEMLISFGNDEVGFAIVASGANGASPHHESQDRIITEKDQVVCDFGGKLSSPALPKYCSDMTRTVFLSEPTGKIREVYEVVAKAQQSAFEQCEVGISCQEIDFAARSVIEEAGYGQYFIHRTGHGIGAQYHEAPYIVEGNQTKLAYGHAFSIEPGIYIPGEFGVRIEDIVIMAEGGAKRLTDASRAITVVR